MPALSVKGNVLFGGSDLSAVLGNFAPVVLSSTAVKDYSAGEYFVYGGKLYVTKGDIAAGEDLVDGSAVTTVAEEFKSGGSAEVLSGVYPVIGDLTETSTANSRQDVCGFTILNGNMCVSNIRSNTKNHKYFPKKKNGSSLIMASHNAEIATSDNDPRIINTSVVGDRVYIPENISASDHVQLKWGVITFDFYANGDVMVYLNKSASFRLLSGNYYTKKYNIGNKIGTAYRFANDCYAIPFLKGKKSIKAKFKSQNDENVLDGRILVDTENGYLWWVSEDESVPNDRYEITVVSEDGMENEEFVDDDSFYEIPSWSSGTYDQIKRALNDHYKGNIDLTTVWEVGDSRAVYIQKIDSEDQYGTIVEQMVNLVILDKNAVNNSAGGKNAFVIGQKEAHVKVQNSSYTTMLISNGTATWEDGYIRQWCNQNYLNALEPELRDIIRDSAITSKYTNDGDTTTSIDKIFLPCVKNVLLAASPQYNGVYDDVSEQQWEYYNVGANRIKGNRASSQNNWATRTARQNGIYYVTSNGASVGGPTIGGLAIAPSFCI